MNPLNIIFDLGGVVLKWPPMGLIENLTEDPILREKLHNEVLRHPDWVEMDRGILNIETMTNRIMERCDFPSGLLNRFFHEVIKSMVPVHKMVDLLKDVHHAGNPAFVLSNMPADFARTLEKNHSFWNLFTGIVFSCDVNLVKPDSAIFEHILSRYTLKPRETVFIDDTEKNTKAAAKLGMKTILFKDAKSTRSRLMELGCAISG